MTIFEPNKERFHIDALLIFLIVAVAFGIFYAVYLYQGMVEFRHALRDHDAIIADLESERAELRSEIYATLNAEQLLKTAESEGLIIDQKPIYLQPHAPAVAHDL